MRNFIFLIFLFTSAFFFSQEGKVDSTQVQKKLNKNSTLQSDLQIISDIETVNAPYKTVRLSPTKAGLYSAVFPGLGQYYNKKYWKIPVVWGAIGTGIGFIVWNDKQYKKYRNAFVSELNGVPHEYSHYNISNLKNALGREQDRWKRYRDYAIGITGLLYVLSIVDAVVDAHLYEGRKDPDLAIKPAVIMNEYGQLNTAAGFSLQYKF